MWTHLIRIPANLASLFRGVQESKVGNSAYRLHHDLLSGSWFSGSCRNSMAILIIQLSGRNQLHFLSESQSSKGEWTMWHIIHRLGAVFAVALLGLVALGLSPTLQVVLGEELQMKSPSKIAHIVDQLVSSCFEYEARRSGDVRSPDLATLSHAVLHVTRAGEIELLLHAARATGPSAEADLETLGATIVSRLQLPPASNLPPAGMIQAWIPYDKVE